MEDPFEYLTGEQVEHAFEVQRLINDGSAWRLEGSYGREMMRMIQDGYCVLGREDFHDAYGNHIPSRTQVEPGTKGSVEYVANLHGSDWAERMDLVAAVRA